MQTRTTAALLAGLSVMALGCGLSDDAAATESGQKVVLEVSGPKEADISFGVDEDLSEENGATLPWKKELTLDDESIIASVDAQNLASGTISCSISVDGKVVKTNKSKGEYALVSCTYSNV